MRNLVSRLFSRLDNHMAEVVRGAAVAFAIKVAAAGLAFAFNVLLARLLGAEGAGLYFLALTVIMVGMTVGRFGLDNTLLRLVAAHAAREEWEAVKGACRTGIALAGGVSLAVTLILLVAAPWLSQVVFDKPELTAPLRWMALGIAPMALVFLQSEMLKALRKVRDSMIVNGIAAPALSIVGLMLLARPFGITGAAWSYAGSAVLTAGLGWLLWRRHAPQLRGLQGRMAAGKLLHSSVPLLWVSLMGMVISWAATFFLGIWGSKADVGIFGAASRTAMLTSFVLVSVNSIVAPKFAALYGQRDMAGLTLVARQSARMMTAIASPVLLAFLTLPGWVMALFGQEFRQGGGLLAIMAIGQFVNVATGSVGYLLIMTGNERLMRNNTLAVGALLVLLCLILIPLYGAVGAAIATSAGMAILNLGSFWLVWKKLGIWTLPFGRTG